MQRIIDRSGLSHPPGKASVLVTAVAVHLERQRGQLYGNGEPTWEEAFVSYLAGASYEFHYLTTQAAVPRRYFMENLDSNHCFPQMGVL